MLGTNKGGRIRGSKFFVSIQNSRLGLMKWKRDVLGNVQNYITKKQATLDGLNYLIITNKTKSQAITLIKEIDKLRETNDHYWRQRSRVKWRAKGTVIQHFSMHYQLIEGRPITSQPSRMIAGVSYRSHKIPNVNTKHLSMRQRSSLEMEFTFPEIKKCFSSLNGNKALRPDGMSCQFFQQYWEIEEQDIGILGMPEMASHDKYLGLPTTLGTSKKEIFNSILEKVKCKWGSNDKKRTVHWTTWSKLCKSKANEGLGFRDLRVFNMVVLSKQAWKIISENHSPLARIYRDIYFPDGNLWTAQLGTKPSFT
ncbi:hypothetical protein LIER_15596 [Lithospermum erythrorhizon]|uniref:Reverse transcriptase n=1 Tax=Lithospermum erythrorhizon TaxID=34254 RepID=A0AAV3Q3K5_LITER